MNLSSNMWGNPSYVSLIAHTDLLILQPSKVERLVKKWNKQELKSLSRMAALKIIALR